LLLTELSTTEFSLNNKQKESASDKQPTQPHFENLKNELTVAVRCQLCKGKNSCFWLESIRKMAEIAMQNS